MFTAVKTDEKGGSIKYTLPDIGQAIERLVYSNPTAAEIPYTEITGTTVYSICGAYGGISAFISHTQNGDTVNDEEDPDANEDIMEN